MKWESIKLEEVLHFVRNGASIKQDENKGGLPITRIETISEGVINETKFGFADIYTDEYEEYYLKKGDILMSHINSWKHLGKTAIAHKDYEVIHGMNLLMLRPIQTVIIPKFLNYYLATNTFKNQLHKISNQSVNQSSFSVTKLRELLVPLPPLPIQQQIADTLDKADALRRKDQELLDKYDELAQAVFYEMFGDPLGNTSIDSRPLSDFCEINPKKSEQNIPDDLEVSFVPMEDVTEKGQVNPRKSKKFTEVKSGFTYFREKDVLFAKITPCMENGKGGIALNLLNNIGFGSTEFHVLRPGGDLSSEFILSLLSLKRVRQKAEKFMSGSAGQKRVSRTFFDNLFIKKPSRSILNGFTNSYQQINNLRELCEKNLQESEKLFNTLLFQSFG